MRGPGWRGWSMVLVLAWGWAGPARAQDREVIPHAQDRPPGPPLSPAEAIAKMTVPDGFRVELVASEPEIVNPVALTFDERGRIWITESLEYPRRTPGPGRDRVKVLEDTDGDGQADKFTIFAEGLNIPSGIAVGHGGVWVANAPDILFLKDTDGDGKADTREVVASGFGRDDTHELPNSLTWGPDGFLYGWNGVFNRSKVTNRKGQTFEFTCAIFRIDPRTRDFDLFCEGTSNPWGIAINPDGAFFASACVIDHLWHLAETGYYIRQGGPYPPFTWPIGSIVDHKHQKAAYCGIHYFDSPAYPPEFRDRLYLGNIHGNCINVDTLEPNGSTYTAKAAPDFLRANDAWFMPVVQKTGPDGSLYVLDWYDRYHCYQDANRDPEGIDRLKGRLYRVRYQDTPRRFHFDLAKSSDEELIRSLGSPNVYDRDIAQRLLSERNHATTRPALQALVRDDQAPRKARMHALWALVSMGRLDPAFHRALLEHGDPTLRAWGVRAAGNMHKVDEAIRQQIISLAGDPSPAVRLQLAIAARKVEGIEPVPFLVEVLSNSDEDPLIPQVVWQNLHPLLEERGAQFVPLVERADLKEAPALVALLPRVIDRLLGRRNPEPAPLVELVRVLALGENAHEEAARGAFEAIGRHVREGSLSDDARERLKAQFESLLVKLFESRPPRPLASEALLLAASWGDPTGLSAANTILLDRQSPEPRRLRALECLAVSPTADRRAPNFQAIALLLNGQAETPAFLGQVLDRLDRFNDPKVAEIVLAAYPKLANEVRPRAIELLTERPSWAKALLKDVAAKRIPSDALNLNQARKLLGSKDAELLKQVRATWGTIRDGRDPRREQVVNRMRDLLKSTPGDPIAGQAVFKKLCAQCHKIYGEGEDVGPDLTGVGRNDFEQLLSNVFDPSLVIGAAYQGTTVATRDGRILNGLLAEDSPERIVLKLQGGKTETIPRADVEESKTSDLSLMPEDVEKELPPQEIADLFTFLCLDKPPSDPTARRLPGSPEVKVRKRK